MSLTMSELCATISSRYDPDEVCDLLEITTEELLDKFYYKLEEKWDILQEELEDDY